MRVAFPLCVMLALALAMAACQAARPVTPQSLRFNCIFSDSAGQSDNDGTGCDPWVQEGICERYVVVTKDRHRNVDACLDACGDARSDLWQQYAASSDCSQIISRGRNLCDRYCLGAYGTPQDDLDPGNLHKEQI